MMYSDQKQYKARHIFENFHPELKRNDEVVFVVMLQNTNDIPGYVPVYLPWREKFLSHEMGDLFSLFSSGEGALGCFEQYQLCFDKRCTEWSNLINVISQMFKLLESNYKSDIDSKVLKVQDFLNKATSLRNFMYHCHRTPLTMLSKFDITPKLLPFNPVNSTNKR